MRRRRSSWHVARSWPRCCWRRARAQRSERRARGRRDAARAPGRRRVTPWGDPDLQGNFTNKDETAPFERPDGSRDARVPHGRGVRRARQAGAGTARPTAEPDPEPRVRRASIPVASGWSSAPRAAVPRCSSIRPTADCRRRPTPPKSARPPAKKRGSGRGPADSYEDRSLYDRCISRGLPGSMMPVIYGNSYRIVQAPGVVAISYEMIHETRLIPVGAAAARRCRDPVLHGRAARAMGRQHARRRDDQLQSEDELSRLESRRRRGSSSGSRRPGPTRSSGA